MEIARTHRAETALQYEEAKIAIEYRAEALLPYKMLPDITDPAWNPDPLVVERLDNEGPYLVGLGLAHRSDLGNLHHRALTRYAANFIAFTDYLGPNHKRVIINEGGVWPHSKSLDFAYEEGGEPQWLQNFGIQTDTEVISPELPNEAGFLLDEGFTPEEIACFYFVRQVPQWQRLTKRPDFATYMQGKMEHLRQFLNFDLSLANLTTLYEDTYGKFFDRLDTRFFYEQSIGYMLNPTSRVQMAAIACNMGRDVNLLRIIQQYFDEGSSLLTVFGWTHIRALQSRLEQLGADGRTSVSVSE